MMHGACAGDAWSKKCPQCKTETVGKWRMPEADRELVGEIEEEGEDELTYEEEIAIGMDIMSIK